MERRLSKADPRRKQDWKLKCVQGGRDHPLAACGVATLCSPERNALETEAGEGAHGGTTRARQLNGAVGASTVHHNHLQRHAPTPPCRADGPLDVVLFVQGGDDDAERAGGVGVGCRSLRRRRVHGRAALLCRSDYFRTGQRLAGDHSVTGIRSWAEWSLGAGLPVGTPAVRSRGARREQGETPKHGGEAAVHRGAQPQLPQSRSECTRTHIRHSLVLLPWVPSKCTVNHRFSAPSKCGGCVPPQRVLVCRRRGETVTQHLKGFSQLMDV